MLNKTAVTTRMVYTHNGRGGDMFRFAVHPVNSSVPLRYYAASGRELEVANRLDERISHIGYVQPTIDIARDDSFFVDSIRLNIIAVLPTSDGHHIKLMLQKDKETWTVKAQSKDGVILQTKDDAGNIIELEIKP